MRYRGARTGRRVRLAAHADCLSLCRDSQEFSFIGWAAQELPPHSSLAQGGSAALQRGRGQRLPRFRVWEPKSCYSNAAGDFSVPYRTLCLLKDLAGRGGDSTNREAN